MNFKPGNAAMKVIKLGLAAISIVLFFVAIKTALCPPELRVYILHEVCVMIEYILMSAAIVFAGAAAFEVAEREVAQKK